MHLAARPRKGSTAAIGSVYGVTFVLNDAQAIPIQPLPEGFGGLPPEHYRCKNFQFGYQMFDVTDVGESAKREVVRTRRSVGDSGLRGRLVLNEHGYLRPLAQVIR